MGTATFALPTAAQVQRPTRTYFGDRMVQFWMVSPSNSYATGGEAFAIPLPKTLDFVDFESLNVDATHVYQPVYDRTNGKLKIINAIGGAELGSGVDLSALQFRAMAVGK